MQIALRRRLRLRLPLGPATCGQEGHGCGRRLDAWGDHALACPRTGYLAKRAKLIERAWIAVCREAVGPEGHVVPQQWLTHTSAPGVPASDRRRLDLVVYGASPQGLALCCDATLVSPVTSEGVPHPRAEHTAGVALLTAERRKHATYPELRLGGGQRLCVLATEVGGRWSRDAHELVRQLVRVRALRAPPALRACASAAWPRRSWGMLSVAVQHAIGGTALGAPWLLPAPGSSFGAGGADRLQPPANALSMVLTARSTARCSGHKLFLGAKKKLLRLLEVFQPVVSGSAGGSASRAHRWGQAGGCCGHVVSAAYVRQKLSQGGSAPLHASTPVGPVSAARRWPACPWLNASGRALHVLSPRRACAETLPPQPRTVRPPRCPPPLACNGELPPVPGTLPAGRSRDRAPSRAISTGTRCPIARQW